MAEPFIGEIRAFGFNFAPRGWAQCDGQLLPIAQYSALFSLLGTTYGGDGRTTFGLPDLRGRSAVHEGSGPGLIPVQLGQKGGAETTTLSVANMPSHNHVAVLHAEAKPGTLRGPAGNMLAIASTGADIYTPADPKENKAMAADSIVVNNTGGGQAFNNRDPFQVVNYCIALQGIFPSRS